MKETQTPEDADRFFDDDIPQADANIRLGYEAALGRCILTFNQLDHLLGTILRTALARLGRADMEKECVSKATFDQRIRFLDILKHSAEGTAILDVSISALRRVGGERNLLAHAHFEQNPFDGSYWLVNRKGQTVQHYTADRIDGVTRQMQSVWNQLRHAEAVYVFSAAPLGVRSGNSP